MDACDAYLDELDPASRATLAAVTARVSSIYTTD